MTSRVSRHRARRDHRRRHHRLLGRLSPDQARLARRGAAGAGAAHLRHDLARGGPRRATARAPEHDAPRPVFGAALSDARSRDRAGDRLEAVRLGPGGAHAGAGHVVQAHCVGGARAGRRLRDHLDRRSGPEISRDAHRRSARRAVAARGRQGQSGGCDAGAGEGRAHERCAHRRADARHRNPSEERHRDRRRRRRAATSRPRSSSTAPANGRSRSGACAA